MYTNLLFIEDWVKNLTQEVKGLIIKQPYRKVVNEFGESYVFEEITVFQNQRFLEEYTAKARAVLSKLDIYRDSNLISELKRELREGQFDDQRTRSLNKYVAKVALLFSDLWLIGFNFDDYYSYVRLPIKDDGHIPTNGGEGSFEDWLHSNDDSTHVDGHTNDTDTDRYYNADEVLDLKDILYRIRTFFKYSCGYKADPNEYTIYSVLCEYADSDSSAVEESYDETNPTVLQWKGDKTDLAELVWALTKSRRIIDQTTGQNVTQIALIRHIETVFGMTLDVTGLMKGRMKTHKAASDDDTFTNTLFGLVKQRAATD